jgi:hypothetical protein
MNKSTDRDVHQQTTSSKARSRHASLRVPRWVLVGDEERVMMRTPAANLLSLAAAWSSTTTLGVTPSSPLYSNWSLRNSSGISSNPLSNMSCRCVWPGTRRTRKTPASPRSLSVRSLLSNTPAIYCAL